MLSGDFRMAALIWIPISRYRIDRAKGKPTNACQCEGRRGGILKSAVIASRKLADAARRDRRLAPGYFEVTAMCRSAWWPNRVAFGTVTGFGAGLNSLGAGFATGNRATGSVGALGPGWRRG